MSMQFLNFSDLYYMLTYLWVIFEGKNYFLLIQDKDISPAWYLTVIFSPEVNILKCILINHL